VASGPPQGVVVSRPFCTFVGDGVVSLLVPVGAALLTMDFEAVLLGDALPPVPPEAGEGFPSFVTVK